MTGMSADWVEAFVADQVQAHPGLKLDLSRTSTGLVILSRIEVPAASRGVGVANAVMTALLFEADANGDTVALTPSDHWGANVNRLRSWYRRLGFVPNKGRTRDLEISEDMYRHPNG